MSRQLFLKIALIMVPSAFAFADVAAKCPGYTFTNEYSFAPINPPAKVIQGVALPGTGHTLFRGAYDANPQFEATTAIQALLGEKNLFVGSPMFWGLTEVLSGHWGLDHTFIPTGGLPLTMNEYIDARQISREVHHLINCGAKNPFTAAEVNSLAKDLMNKIFERMTHAEIESRYFNMKDPSYYLPATQNLGFGNNAVDFMISSYYDQIASIYGRKVLIYKDSRQRALDLGFWNFTHTASFWDGWVDNGEVNTPGYITGDEIVGYQQRRDDRARVGWGSSDPANPISVGFYKVNLKNKTYVIAVGGDGHQCILQDPVSQKIYFCLDNWSGKIMTGIIQFPVIANKSVANLAPLIGVIHICTDDSCETEANELADWYGKSTEQKIDPAVFASINALKVNGQEVVYSDVKKIAPVIPKIKIVSATYYDPKGDFNKDKGNGTAAAAAFCDGHDSIEYKVSWKHLKLAQPASVHAFKMDWTCTGSAKLHTKTIPAPAEDQKFTVDCE